MVLKIIFAIFVLVFVNCIRCEFNLTVVHISDFHSNWFEFDENKHDCSKQESKEGKCFGGFPRLLSFVRDIKKREKNVLVLSSGEFFFGRSLHALDGWRLAHALLPRIELDAMCLSNHDFDSGVFELSGLLYAMKFPVLCANMWARNTSFLYSRVNKSVVIDVDGEKVGIVGYIHRHALKKTRKVASVKFLPEIPALQEEVQRLESEGVNKIIALGHAGYYTDLEIARKVKGVDLVIGGDSDIMLFDPGPDANETSKIGNIHGNYPRVHQQEPEMENDLNLANRTLVLHIPQHGMFVGVLKVTFDDNGKIIHESGEPVLLDSSIPQDEDTLAFMEFAKGALENLAEHSRLPDESELLGKVDKHLDGTPRNCRMRECSLGNFIVDAMLHEFTFHYKNKTGRRYDYEHWGPIDAIVFNSGAIKRSIEPGYITIKDILKSVSLGGFIKGIYMSGKQLMDMMEHSVKHYDLMGVTPPGAFLQMAGLRVEYNLSQSPGKRVKQLSIRCRDCEDADTYFPVKLYKTYVIGMPSFLMDGGDGFYDFEEVDNEDMGQFDVLLLVEYLRRRFDIEPILDGRIKFYQSENRDLDLTLGVPPLLFGEPLPVDNSPQDLHSDPVDEQGMQALPEYASDNKSIDNELMNKLPNLLTDKYVTEAAAEDTSSKESISNKSVKNSPNVFIGEHVTEVPHKDISSNENIGKEHGSKTPLEDLSKGLDKESMENQKNMHITTISNRSIDNGSLKDQPELISNRTKMTSIPTDNITGNKSSDAESVKNQQNLNNDPIDEHTSKAYSEGITGHLNIDNESSNEIKNTNSINDQVSKISLDFVDEHDSQKEIIPENNLSKDESELQRASINAKATEQEIKSASQHENDILMQSIAKKLYSALTKEKSEELFTSVLSNNTKIVSAPEIVETLKNVLNSSAENYRKLQSIEATDLKDRLIKKRLLLESLNSDQMNFNHTELEDYVKFMETFFLDLVKDVIPLTNSSNVGSATMENPDNSNEAVKKFIKDAKGEGTEKVPEIDFREIVIKVLKNHFGEDILKEMANVLTHNFTTADENQP